MKKLEWIVRRVPPRRKPIGLHDLQKLKKADLADRAWAAEMTSECSLEVAAEAWARLAEAVAMLEGKCPVDQALIALVNEHTSHVNACRMGSCEHEYAALVRAELLEPAPPAPRG